MLEFIGFLLRVYEYVNFWGILSLFLGGILDIFPSFDGNKTTEILYIVLKIIPLMI